jgi:phosphatidylglycerophosphate synthase
MGNRLANNRRLYERIGQSVGKIGMAIGLSPNAWTLMGLAISVVTGILFWQRMLGWALVSMIAIAITDVMDGSTARAGNLATPFGGVLDHVVDRYEELIVSAGILLSGLVPPFWVFFGAAGALMASYVRAKAESMTDIEHCNVGLAGRQEKTYILLAGIIVQMLGIGVGALGISIAIVGLVSHTTAVQRVIYTYRTVGRPTGPAE